MKSIACTLGFVLVSCFCASAQQQDVPKPAPVKEEKVICTFDVIEQEAMPVGGMRAFYELLYKNIRYPEAAIRHSIEGTAYIRFTIDEQGNVSDAQAVEGRELGYGIDEEAIRVIKMSKWVPGRDKGEHVAMRKIMPVKFKLPQEKSKKKKS